MATVGLDRLVESVVQRAAQDLDSFIDTFARADECCSLLTTTAMRINQTTTG